LFEPTWAWPAGGHGENAAGCGVARPRPPVRSAQRSPSMGLKGSLYHSSSHSRGIPNLSPSRPLFPEGGNNIESHLVLPTPSSRIVNPRSSTTHPRSLPLAPGAAGRACSWAPSGAPFGAGCLLRLSRRGPAAAPGPGAELRRCRAGLKAASGSVHEAAPGTRWLAPASASPGCGAGRDDGDRCQWTTGNGPESRRTDSEMALPLRALLSISRDRAALSVFLAPIAFRARRA
jgi:hypothetical protein